MNLRTLCLTILLTALMAGTLSAQNWTKLKKEGDEFAAVGDYGSAADRYYKAWKSKDNKLNLAFTAGQYYSYVKEYDRAAECLAVVADWNEPEQKAGYLYALALKQSGDPSAAIQAFDQFLQTYAGPDQEVLAQRIAAEVAGCRLALQEARPQSTLQMDHAGKHINSTAADFGPVPYGDDIVYFTSTRDGMARIYRSLLNRGRWEKPEVPQGLPTSANKHIANGAFSTSGNAFYYTICEQRTDQEKLGTRCELYVMTRRGSSWDKGRRLPDYINLAESHQTHPYSTEIDGQEVLFFSTDRPGGEGGLDIWMVTRELSSNELDYSFPQKLNQTINTVGDEVTPFYDQTLGRIYFSSNGHPAIGGLDIFQADGAPGNWKMPLPVGEPLNSPADDLYFRMTQEGTSGFLVSNRAVRGVKNHTRDEDLFYLTSDSAPVVVRGQVLDRLSGQPLTEVRVSIYHFVDGQKTVFNSQFAEDGRWEFIVPGQLEAFVVAEKFEYEPSSYKIDYQEAEGGVIKHDLSLIEETMPDEEPVASAPQPEITEGDAPETEPTDAGDPIAPVMEEIVDANQVDSEPAPSAETESDHDAMVETEIADNDSEDISAPAIMPEEVALNSPETPAEEETRLAPEELSEATNDVEEVAAAPLVDSTKNQISSALIPEVAETENPTETTSPDPETTTADLAEADENEANLPENPEETPQPANTSQLPVSDNPAAPSTELAEEPTNAQPIMQGELDETPMASADMDLFTGSGLDRRYRGNRVDKRKYESETQPFAGTYYRIQLEATDHPDPSAIRYMDLASIGEIETETLPELGLTRMLLGVLWTPEEALSALRAARSTGFDQAYIVRYQDGIRLRRWK